MKINSTQKDSKCKLYKNRDGIVNHIVSKCSKQAQKKYKTRHDWRGYSLGIVQVIKI